jgi:hypothetical protein
MKPSAKLLLEKALNTHGGENAPKFKTVKLHANIGGATWAMKGHADALADVQFTGSLTKQKASWINPFQPGYPSVFEPDKVQLFDEKGTLLEELNNPLDSFKGHRIETPWTKAQLIYFSNYAIPHTHYHRSS